MLKNVIIAITLLTNFTLIAQNSSIEKVILTNGETHTGIVIEQVPGEYIQLYRTMEKDTLKIEMSDIERMIRQLETEPSPQQQKENKEDPNAWIWGRQKYNNKFTYIMIHGAMGAGDYVHQGLGLSLGYNFYEFQVGAGVQYYGSTSWVNNGEWQTLPIAIDIRYLFSQSKSGRFATFLSLSGGYNVVLSRDVRSNIFGESGRAENGLYLFPSLAFRMNIGKNLGLMLDLGYHMNNAKVYGKTSDTLLGTLRYDNILLRGSLFF